MNRIRPREVNKSRLLAYLVRELRQALLRGGYRPHIYCYTRRTIFY